VDSCELTVDSDGAVYCSLKHAKINIQDPFEVFEKEKIGAKMSERLDAVVLARWDRKDFVECIKKVRTVLANIFWSMNSAMCEGFDSGHDVHLWQGLLHAYRLGWFANLEVSVFRMKVLASFINNVHTVIPGALFAIKYQQVTNLTGSRSRKGETRVTTKICAKQLEPLNIKTVVRLTNDEFKDEEMQDHGVRCVSCDFDGDIPPPGAVNLFLHTLRTSGGAVAVLCDGDSGRAGLFCAMHLMHAHGFSAPAAMAWLRLSRPGAAALSPSQSDYLHFLDPSRPNPNDRPPPAGSPPDAPDAVFRRRVYRAWRLYEDWLLGGPRQRPESKALHPNRRAFTRTPSPLLFPAPAASAGEVPPLVVGAAGGGAGRGGGGDPARPAALGPTARAPPPLLNRMA
jgi:hypothetical protein